MEEGTQVEMDFVFILSPTKLLWVLAEDMQVMKDNTPFQ
jgi:hypothetical protein